MYLKGQGVGLGQRDVQVFQGEIFFVEFLGMSSCFSLMRIRYEVLGICGRREICFGVLGMDCRMRGWGGLLEELLNFDVRNGLFYYIYFLLFFQLSCLRVRRRQGNFIIVIERLQEERFFFGFWILVGSCLQFFRFRVRVFIGGCFRESLWFSGVEQFLGVALFFFFRILFFLNYIFQ